MVEKAQQLKGESDSYAHKLYRSPSNKIISGVCGGVAEYLGIEAIIVRIIWAVAVFFGGLGFFAYIISWIVIPENPNPEITRQDTSNQSNSSLIWGSILIFVGALLLLSRLDIDLYPFYFYWDWLPYWLWRFPFDLILPLAIIAFGVYYIFTTKKDETKTKSAAIKTGDSKMAKKLTRSVKDRMLAGVCGGLADYFNIDSSLVRIGFALLTLAGGGFIGIVTYIIMLIVVPEEDTIVQSTSGTTPTKTKAATKSKSAKTTAKRSTKPDKE